VTSNGDSVAGSRLRRLAQRAAPELAAPQERCELCSEPIPPEHRHLLDLESGELMCACRACTVLFDRNAAGGGHYRLVPDRRLRIVDFALDDVMWEELRIPVEMAFFFRSTSAGRTMAFYPGPMGATESLLELDAWDALEAANPVLSSLEPDVEALLVNRARGARDHWLVPVDECYALVGLIRMRWKGLSGGREVWEEISRFIDELDGRSRAVNRDGGSGQTSPAAVAAGREEG
jgi:Family of unknown function (DUF5947)